MQICDEPASPPAPLYVKIKRLIQQKILSGEFAVDGRIPSENELVRDLGISRMTVNRALRELSGEGILLRVPGVGTFVASTKVQSDFLEIKNLADDIRGRGHRHSAEPKLLREEQVKPEMARTLGVREGTAVYHLVCVHRENGLAVQLEDRFVNPAAAPDFLVQDFTQSTATEYLLRVIAASEAEHVIEAVRPSLQAQRWLAIGADEPCLVLRRTTWSSGVPVTHASLLYPGSRYRLGGRFAPRAMPRRVPLN
jgi:GntR family histidine utilization transcriptional repressor